jgi:hypothetical protein
VDKVSILLGSDAASLDVCFPTFRGNVVVLYSTVEIFKKKCVGISPDAMEQRPSWETESLSDIRDIFLFCGPQSFISKPKGVSHYTQSWAQQTQDEQTQV